jgi:hypothetical protein
MLSNFSGISLIFLKNKSLKVNFFQLNLISNSGLLLIRQAEEKIKICQGFAGCLDDKRQLGKITHSQIRLTLLKFYK